MLRAYLLGDGLLPNTLPLARLECGQQISFHVLWQPGRLQDFAQQTGRQAPREFNGFGHRRLFVPQ